MSLPIWTGARSGKSFQPAPLGRIDPSPPAWNVTRWWARYCGVRPGEPERRDHHHGGRLVEVAQCEVLTPVGHDDVALRRQFGEPRRAFGPVGDDDTRLPGVEVQEPPTRLVGQRRRADAGPTAATDGRRPARPSRRRHRGHRAPWRRTRPRGRRRPRGRASPRARPRLFPPPCRPPCSARRVTPFYRTRRTRDDDARRGGSVPPRATCGSHDTRRGTRPRLAHRGARRHRRRRSHRRRRGARLVEDARAEGAVPGDGRARRRAPHARAIA